MTSAPSEAAAGPEPFDFAKIRWIYFGLLIGMFTSAISGTIVAPAIPRIVSELGGVQYYSWLSTIVMLVSAIVTPISGKLADMFGRRRFYVLGLVLFMIGSALSGLATSFTFLVAARAVQGVAMGILMPLSQTILGDVIPPRQRGKYAGYMGALMGASQVAGPLIGHERGHVGLVELGRPVQGLHRPDGSQTAAQTRGSQRVVRALKCLTGVGVPPHHQVGVGP